MVKIDTKKAIKLSEIIRWINTKGWSPATSTNYSFKNTEYPLSIAISQSGIDKGSFDINHFMLINEMGNPLDEYAHLKPSAETYLHSVLYQENKDVEVILHTHSVYGTILSDFFYEKGHIILSNYEVLKGLGDIKTHETDVVIPIFKNTQDIATLSEEFRSLYKKEKNIYAYLIAGHGLYTWGRSMEEAKRQLEVLEFLLECEYKKLLLKSI